MKKKLLYISILAFLFFFTSAAAVNAASLPDPDQMAIYLRNGFYGDSAIVTGDMYSANGNITFSSSGDNSVSGSIYHKTGTQFTVADWLKPRFDGHVIALDNTSFDGTIPDMLDFPAIDHYVEQYVPAYETPPLTISENTHFGTLSVGKAVIVDVSQRDIYVVVDRLSCDWGQAITLNGNGRLFLFVGQYSSSNPLNINNGNNPDKTYIFSRANLANSSLNLSAHIYYSGLSTLPMRGTITGSIATDASSVTLSGGTAKVNGLVFAPNANATVEGSALVNGRLVADSMILRGTGKVVYNSSYSSSAQCFPAEVQKYLVKVQVNILEGGTVSPSSVKVNYGDIVHITAAPNAGFLFAGFTSSNNSMLPDANGRLKITGPVTVTANFRAEGNYVNGLLGEYFDTSELNDTSLRMKRIDANIAFNFMYNPPDPALDPETFSIRWTGYIKPQVTGDYIFKTYSDDGVRVMVDGNKVIDKWGAMSLDFTVANVPTHLEAGQYYPITVEYQQLPLYAAVFLFWEADDVPMSIVPESAYFVTQDTYKEYSPAEYYNETAKSGSGLKNTFYALDENGSHIQQYTEVNNIAYDWGLGAPHGIGSDVFYGVMEGYIEAKYTESITLEFIVDDGIRVWIGDESDPVISEWDLHSQDMFTCELNAIAGEKYRIRIEYADFIQGAICVMKWKGDALGEEVVPTKYLYDRQ